MTDFGRFRAGLDFGFPDLRFFVYSHKVFLKLSSEVVDILLGDVEHESCVDVTIICGWSAICIPLTEIRSIKEIPSVCQRDSF